MTHTHTHARARGRKDIILSKASWYQAEKNVARKIRLCNLFYNKNKVWNLFFADEFITPI